MANFLGALPDRRTGADHHGVVGDSIPKRLGDPLRQLGGDAIRSCVLQETLVHKMLGRDVWAKLGQQPVEGRDVYRRGV